MRITMARITAGPFRSILPASTYGLGAALSTLATKNRLRFIYQPSTPRSSSKRPHFVSIALVDAKVWFGRKSLFRRFSRRLCGSFSSYKKGGGKAGQAVVTVRFCQVPTRVFEGVVMLITILFN